MYSVFFGGRCGRGSNLENQIIQAMDLQVFGAFVRASLRSANTDTWTGRHFSGKLRGGKGGSLCVCVCEGRAWRGGPFLLQTCWIYILKLQLVNINPYTPVTLGALTLLA